MRSSSSSGKVTAESRVGGLAGWLDQITLSGSSNKGAEVVATGYFAESGVKYGYVGGYVGRGYSVDGCLNTSNITYTAAGQYVGGIAGYVAKTINSSTNTGNITAENSSYVGGIVGMCDGDKSYTLANLTNTGDITGYDYVGGIIGNIHNKTGNNNDYTVSSDRLVNNGDVAGNSYVGGVIGNAYFYESSTFYWVKLLATEYINTGNITGNAYVGGLIGKFYSDASSKLTYYTCEGNLTEVLVGENSNLTISKN